LKGPESDKPEISCSSDTGGVITSGGGFSNLYPRPSWQTSAVESYLAYINSSSSTPTSGFNISGRAYPDISVLGYNYNLVIGKKLVLIQH
jgi:tripeptidyl-peptidase-1